ncbi:MAG: Rrf2 family transcriptional regulator [Planctomycetes bacterium]|nr:Rrf2 family transcriptional regulator [Planctomycetota bacterium]
MDVIRRNTDYALRLMVGIASAGTTVSAGTAASAGPMVSAGRAASAGPMVSARKLSGEQDVPYQLACKLLQKLHGAGFLQSRMGAKGGFMLAKKPCAISLADMINAIQGPLSLNRCMLGKDQCPKQPNCPIGKKLKGLQNYIEGFLTDVTLEELSGNLNS